MTYLADPQGTSPSLGAVRLEVGVILVGRDAAVSDD